MRFRGKSIRRKIVALLLVPLLSLVAIWAFAAVITSQGVFGLFQVQQVTDTIGYPVENGIEALAAERRAALVYIADPRRSGSDQNLHSAEQDTDKALAVVRDHSSDSSARGMLDAASLQRLDALVKQAGDIETVRRQIDNGQISRAAAFSSYSAMIDPYYRFFLGLDPLQSVQLDRQARVLTELSRAREYVAREDALYAASQVAGRMTREEQREFSDATIQQRTVFDTYPQLLPDTDAGMFEDYWKSSTGRQLHSAEEQIITAQPTAAPTVVSPAVWQATASSVLGDLATLNHQAAENYKQRVKPFAVGVLVKAGIAGGFGLLAVVASVVVSLRIGRSLARDLSGLRKEAQEASGTRLPRVMRRLAAGEEVDVETEVPRLEYTEDEIGQVGRALNTLQRAAVEAAVRQADMRRGVSDVFVNLARRNQVLLHRQLTLLDSMERRSDAGEELADLFKLDHMTTRMRRHAEGLVILSGAAPSRQWRKPVPLMDVVRAAVAEVEDYERVEVRRLARLSVTGTAVADVTHLVAELVENATVFSPPHTTVQVHGERVANGFVLEIDDRGLGMGPDALLDANLRLAETPEFELSDTDRLGLFVVSRLAQRQGVRVSLRQSPYGGTTAVVLIPTTLLSDIGADDSSGTAETPAPGAIARLAGGLAEPPDEIELPVAVASSVVGEQDEQVFREWGLLPPEVRAAADGDFVGTGAPHPFEPPAEQHQQIPDTTDRDLPRRTEQPRTEQPREPAPESGAEAPLPRRRRSPVLVADRGRRVRPAPERAPLPEVKEEPTASGGLPRRVRQASLAPQLRDEDTVERCVDRPAATGTPAPQEIDADQVRSRMASLQRGWQRGRAEADDDSSSVPATDSSRDDQEPRTTKGDGR